MRCIVLYTIVKRVRSDYNATLFVTIACSRAEIYGFGFFISGGVVKKMC